VKRALGYVLGPSQTSPASGLRQTRRPNRVKKHHKRFDITLTHTQLVYAIAIRRPNSLQLIGRDEREADFEQGAQRGYGTAGGASYSRNPWPGPEPHLRPPPHLGYGGPMPMQR